MRKPVRISRLICSSDAIFCWWFYNMLTRFRSEISLYLIWYESFWQRACVCVRIYVCVCSPTCFTSSAFIVSRMRLWSPSDSSKSVFAPAALSFTHISISLAHLGNGYKQTWSVNWPPTQLSPLAIIRLTEMHTHSLSGPSLVFRHHTTSHAFKSDLKTRLYPEYFKLLVASFSLFHSCVCVCLLVVKSSLKCLCDKDIAQPIVRVKVNWACCQQGK